MTLAAVLDLRAMAIAPIVVAYFVYMYIKDNNDKKNLRPTERKSCSVCPHASCLPTRLPFLARFIKSQRATLSTVSN